MVQMTPADQAIVKAIPGNDKCADCGMKSPQWASVSFGTVFCLECSGVHRSLGVHISFVRSIAMDSWTDPQLKLMKCGGNQKCADYLSAKGVASGTAIKPKYESDAAQLYKAVLKARAEGRPEPTELVKKPPRNNSGYASSMSSASAGSSMHGGGAAGGGAVGKAGEDPNGMERLTGETDAQYVARQTRLRDEAKARMAAKFGGGGGGGMGGVGSSGGGMGGIGSDSSYNPATGGYGGGGMGGSVDVNAVTDSLVSGFGTALGALGSAATAATTTASSFVADPGTQQTLTSLKSSAGGLAGGFWGSLSAGATAVASAVTAPDDAGDDGLADLQRQFSQQRGAQPSKYAGFGSESASASASASATTSSHSYGNTATSTFSSSAAAAAAPAPAPSTSGAMTGHLPGEDPNGMERLTGETDEQYVARQTRLRDEAKARMAAKFGGGGMGGVGSSGPSSGGGGGGMMGGMGSMMGGIMGGMMGAPAPAPAPAAPAPMSAPAPKLPTAASRAPASGNSMQDMKKKMQNSDDFFASFGS